MVESENKEKAAVPEVDMGTDSSDSRLYSDPTIARAMQEDPILKWASKNLRFIVVLFAAIGAVLFIKGRFEETRAFKLGEAADLYARVSAEFGTLTNGKVSEGEAGEKEKNEEAKRKLNDTLLALADSSAPYASLSGLYRGLESIAEGSVEDAKVALGNEYVGRNNEDSLSKAFLDELKAVSIGRAMLSKPETLEKGKAVLKAVTLKGQYLDVVAAVSLAKAAQTDSEKEEAKKLLDSVVASQPEQSQIVEKEMARVG